MSSIFALTRKKLFNLEGFPGEIASHITFRAYEQQRHENRYRY